MKIGKTWDKTIIRGQERSTFTTWTTNGYIRWVLNPEMEEVGIIGVNGKPDSIKKLYNEVIKLDELRWVKKVIAQANTEQEVRNLYRIGFRSPFVPSDKLSNTMERFKNIRSIWMWVNVEDDDVLVDYTAEAKRYNLQFSNEYGWE